MALIEPEGFQVDPEPTCDWLLRGQMPSGAVRTAHGFASQVAQRAPGAVPEFRDILPVVGWNDKVFRCWTEQLPEGEILGPAHSPAVFEQECLLRGQQCLYREDNHAIELLRGDTVLYRWIKGSDWAEVCTREAMWK